MGLSRTVSEIDSDFRRKLQNFPTPLYARILCPRRRDFPWNWVSALGVEKSRMMGLLGRGRILTISSAVWIQSTNVIDGRTDRGTDTGRQQRPRLCIASRGKNPQWKARQNMISHFYTVHESTFIFMKRRHIFKFIFMLLHAWYCFCH